MPKKGNFVICFVESEGDLNSRADGYSVLRVQRRPYAPVLVLKDEAQLQEGLTYFVEITGRIPRGQFNPNHSAGYFGRVVCGA